ncbi:SDR family oxidoreductase [Pendulispora rubella]|uniref:SDR family oxidoreductase n=1 Tax=Pendulispora rubella TaxID=2741070 RepID=A0ABZ2LAE2_9BACT
MSTNEKGTALITGASSGIGAIYADRLARRGYDLLLVSRNEARLHAVAERISRDTGRSIGVLAANLADPADSGRIEAQLRTNADITMLVNNAGVGAAAPLLNADVNAMTGMIDINVHALTRLTYAAVPGFVKRGRGTIINVSSIVAIAPEALNGVYGGSKAFVLAFSQSLRHELSDKGVRVQVVLPGATATDFWDIAGQPLSKLPEQIVMSAEDMVDASLAALDQGEFVTIPSLPHPADWDAFEAARAALRPNLSHKAPAARYGIKTTA